MHLLDRLAALAVIFQFLFVIILGIALYQFVATTNATLKSMEVRLYTMPTPSPEVMVVTPTPSGVVKSGVATGAATSTFRYTK